MSMFWEVSLPGFEGRSLISRNQDYDKEPRHVRIMEVGQPVRWVVDDSNPLDPARFKEGYTIELEDWGRDADIVFRMNGGRWVEDGITEWD